MVDYDSKSISMQHFHSQEWIDNAYFYPHRIIPLAVVYHSYVTDRIGLHLVQLPLYYLVTNNTL